MTGAVAPGLRPWVCPGRTRQPPVWHRLCGCPRGVAQERRALLTGDHQGRDGDAGEQSGRQGTVPDDGRIVGEGVRDRLQAGTERDVPQLRHYFMGEADRLSLVKLDGVAAAARGHQAGQFTGETGRQGRVAVIGVERRLIQHQAGDGKAARGGLERESGAGGVPEDRRGPARLRDQRGDVVDLPRDRVRCGVAAVAPAPPVVIQRREPRRERSRQRLGL